MWPLPGRDGGLMKTDQVANENRSIADGMNARLLDAGVPGN